MKLQIKQFSIHQTSKVLTICNVALGLLFIPIGVLLIIGGQTAVGIIYVLMPLIYGTFTYPIAAAMCWVYGIIAKGTGGFEFTVQQVGPEATQTQNVAPNASHF